MLASKKVIGIKTETTQGTGVSLAATDFFHAWDVEILPDAEIIERKYVSSSLDRFAHLIGKRWTPVKFKTHLRGSGTAGTPLAPLDAILQAIGLTSTAVPATSVTYAPSSNPAANFYGPGKSATVKLYEDGSATASSSLLTSVAGCMGDLKMSIEAGKPVELSFEGKGIYAAVADDAVPTNTPGGATAPVVVSASLSMHSYSAIVQKLEINFGNELIEKPNVSAATGILGFQIGARNPSGSMDPEAVLVAAHDFFGRFIAGTEGALSIVVGATAGNITTITASKIQYGRPTKGTRSGDLMTFQVPFMFNRNSGDDWFSMVQT